MTYKYEIFHFDQRKDEYTVLELNSKGFLRITKGIKGVKDTTKIIMKLTSSEMYELSEVLRLFANSIMKGNLKKEDER